MLNLAVWAATTGCGITQRVLFEDKIPAVPAEPVTDSELQLSEQVRSILWFHVYFTVRRILHELGGIQSIVALPGDPTFNKINAKCDKPSFERLCKEFKAPNTNFCFEQGPSHGLGHIYAYGYKVPEVVNKWPSDSAHKFADQGAVAPCGCLIDKIKAPKVKQWEHFISDVLGSLLLDWQESIQSSKHLFIAVLELRSIQDHQSAIETEREFLVLLESAILQPDISKSVQRFPSRSRGRGQTRFYYLIGYMALAAPHGYEYGEHHCLQQRAEKSQPWDATRGKPG